VWKVTQNTAKDREFSLNLSLWNDIKNQFSHFLKRKIQVVVQPFYSRTGLDIISDLSLNITKRF
jgi:hypothetical protein